MITAGEIKVQSRYAVDRLSDMELDIREGCHGKLVLRGWISGTGVRTDDVIRITVPGNEDGREAVLFDGIIREAHIFLEGGVKQVILEAAAHSIRLDRQKNSRSFQDVSITYDRIVEHILSGYRGALTCGYPPLQTGIPVIQYQETDWEFCRRMAGSMGLGIFCDETAGRPAVRLGRPEGERRAVFQEDSYRCGTDESCCRRRQESGTSKAEFLYYEVLSEGNYAVGDYADCRGRKRYIFEKHAEVINGVLMFRYKLGGEAHFRKSREYNRRLAGCSLPGLAVRTEGGNVFIRLDIDGEDGQAGYPYPWRPLTGGIMYCMPRAGTRVSLYFPDCHEERAYAVNCIRTNGGRPCFSDPQSREFVTEHGRRMQLYADSICFEGGRHIFSMGEGGCVLKTAGSMQVVSGGRVRLSAPDITVKTPSGISQIKNREYAGRHGSCTGSMNPATGGDASFAMQHEFNGLAGQGILHGTEYEEYKPFDDAPGYDHPAGAKIVSGVMTALLVGAAAGLLVFVLAPASPLLVGAGITAVQAGVFTGAVTSGAGTAAVAATYARDRKTGESSPIDTYTGNAFMASAQVGGAVVQLLLIPRGAELLGCMSTGGMAVPVMKGVLTPEQVYVLSQAAGRGIAVENLIFQMQDVNMFIWEGKELGGPTENETYNKLKDATEFSAGLLTYYGIWNPCTYEKVTISLLPDTLESTLPAVQNALGANQKINVSLLPDLPGTSLAVQSAAAANAGAAPISPIDASLAFQQAANEKMGVEAAANACESGSNSIYKEVNIHGKINTEIDEVDLVNQIIYEDKSAGKLYMENADFPQTEQQWAFKQIYKKGSNRIDAINQSEYTLSIVGDENVPNINSLKSIRNYVFRIDTDTPALRQAVEECLDKLRAKYPEYNFSATYGGK